MKVVIVEDDELLARHYIRVLEKEGNTVHHIAHALGAIDLIDQVKPDVLVLDMLLTGSTAMVLLHELQSHSDLAKLPIVVTSNLSDLRLDTLAPYGVVRILDKATMHPSDLAAAVRATGL